MASVTDLPPPPASLLDGAALFLDFDGTLVELAETPDAITVPDNLQGLLKRLEHRLQGRLAIVTGRALASLERHLSCAGLALSGSHGLELRLADGTQLPVAAPAFPDAATEAVLIHASTRPGLLVERKPAGLAVHFRNAVEEEAGVSALLSELAGRFGLVLQTGKMVVELRVPGADKGDAVRALMREPAFAGARPLFVGDDQTDEHGFRAAAALGGAGILVGPIRDTDACYRLEGVEEVALWLRNIAR